MFSERLKELRLANNWTQVQLAKQLNITKQAVSNWENGNILPSIDMLLNISRLFSVTTDYLLGLDDRKTIFVDGLNEKELASIKMLIKSINKTE